MSMEGLQAQILGSPLPRDTHKFSLCPHSQLTDMCLLTAPPSFLHSPSTSWPDSLLDSHPVCGHTLPALPSEGTFLAPRTQASASQPLEASPQSFTLSSANFLNEGDPACRLSGRTPLPSPWRMGDV